MRPDDLTMCYATIGGYKHKIAESSAFAQALAYAEQGLVDVEAVTGKDLRRTFLDEVEYLWSVFPCRLKNLDKYKDLLSVLLGQTTDFCWYADFPKYCNDQDVESDDGLYSFRRGSPDFEVGFVYIQYYRHILMRIPNALRLRYRRMINHPGRYTQGLTTTRCKPAIAGLINQLSEDVARELQPRKPLPLLVNSVLRTVEYQDSLARIGYVAPRSSSHLAGYAVDIEQRWYQQHHTRAHQALHHVLHGLFARGVINLIDEGTHWHLCLNPTCIRQYEELFSKWVWRAR